MLTNKRRGERIPIQLIDPYISKVVTFVTLLLRNLLILQEEFSRQGDYEEALYRGWGFSFLDITCHELVIGRTIRVSGTLIECEQDPIEILGVQNAFLVLEDNDSEKYDFEIEKGNYRRLKKELEKNLGDRLSFDYTVMNVLSSNHSQGRIKNIG